MYDSMRHDSPHGSGSPRQPTVVQPKAPRGRSSKAMNIREVRTYITWGEPRNWVFTKVQTDAGLHGWGEATLEGKEETVCTCIRELSQMLIDQDPLSVEHNWQALYRHSYWRSGPVLSSALGALDQALWDIR